MPENYQKLYELNNDFKGWIYIPNTKISYLLAQTNNDEYYLKHNFKKENIVVDQYLLQQVLNNHLLIKIL